MPLDRWLRLVDVDAFNRCGSTVSRLVHRFSGDRLSFAFVSQRLPPGAASNPGELVFTLKAHRDVRVVPAVLVGRCVGCPFDRRSTLVDVQGEEQLFPDGDGLYMDGRTLYIMQNFAEKIAVVRLSEDLTQGTFVKNLVSDDFSIPTTITGYGDCVYAINTSYWEFTAEGVDPNLVQTEVVKVFK